MRIFPRSILRDEKIMMHFFPLLDENNRPMMLPNGFVYGYGALAKMAQENDGQIVCPRTKEIYPIAEVEKVFVM